MIVSELRQAARRLIRRPALSATVLATLALGLGAGAGIFHVTDAVLLRSLPYPEAGRLVSVWSTLERETVERRQTAYPDFLDIQQQASSFESMAAYESGYFTVADGGARATRIGGAWVSRDFFATLGAVPALGTGLQVTERGASVEEGAGVRQVMVSHDLWQQRFGGDASVLGRVIELDGDSHEVVGVMPEDFVPLNDGAQLWVALEELPARLLENRSSRWHSMVARLSAGSGLGQARQELQLITSRLDEAHPDSNARYRADLSSLSNDLAGDLRSPLILLLAAAGLLLLVTSANVAGLLRVHAARLTADGALRRALGATHWQVLRSRWSETAILSAVGGALGLVVAALLSRWLTHASPVALPGHVDLGLGARLVAFTLLLALGTAVLVVLGTLVVGSAGEIAFTLRSGGGRLSARLPGVTALLVCQVALASVLVVGAGMLLISFNNLLQVDPGFHPERLAFARVGLPALTAEDEEARRGQRDEETERLLALASVVPGVEAAALADTTPLDGSASATILAAEGMLRVNDAQWDGALRVYRHRVGRGYFGVLGVRILQGRGFDTSDRRGSQPVAVVSQRLAERLWPGGDAVGRRVKLGRPVGPDQDASEIDWFRVIGVVAEHRQRSLVPERERSPGDPDIWFSLEQSPRGDLAVAVRTTGEPSAFLPALRDSLEALSPAASVYGLQTMDERLRSETSRTRFASSLLSGFAIITLFLAALGIYGLIAYQVEATLRDAGVRLALGARVDQVVGVSVGRVWRWLAAGIGSGLVLAFFGARPLRSELYGIGTVDPRVYASAAILLLAAGSLAALLPSLRAGRVNPIEVLRSE